ncbi:HK97 family phage major capsid protein [Lutibacter sp. Hel_I_33_5]|uniref:phage major capsid protein n=1 Tax=Lutibacter sp. Hel_I_33_5 TaxID=1566289 RepID=UPI0011A5AF28|nr:phage major capsid protein [Lutibacter sp. Hel_I_33_5]TVZ55605.1 HK97 family phage major capsid protein [Lutibacter sp. Hel_I_33_5]
MKNSTELKQERASKIDAQEVIMNAAKGRAEGERNLTDAETVRFDALQVEVEAFDVDIARVEKFEANQAARSKSGGTIGAPVIHGPKKAERFSLLKGLRNLANGKSLVGAEKDLHDQTQEEMRNQGLETKEGLVLSMPMENRNQNVDGSSGAKGGVLVASTPQLIRPLQPKIAIESLGVNVMSGLVGDVPLPTSGAFTFSYAAENAPVNPTDVSFSGPTLKPKRCSGVVDISKKLLAQTSFDIEAYIIEQINIAYGNAVMQNAISGSGGAAPTGLLDLITTNINTTAGVGTYNTVVALEGLVDDANGTSVSRGYLSDTKLRASLKTTKIDAGSGIFLTDGKELNGYNYLASTLVPTLDTNKHPLIFGDWNQLTVGYWGSISIMVDPYTQAASSNVRLIIEGFSDVAVANEKAFAVNKVMTL